MTKVYVVVYATVDTPEEWLDVCATEKRAKELASDRAEEMFAVYEPDDGYRLKRQGNEFVIVDADKEEVEWWDVVEADLQE